MEVKFDHDKLKTLRKKQKLSQSRLAELSGTTDRYIRFIEKGKKTNPSAIILYKVSKVLGNTVEDFMDSSPDAEENGHG